MTGPVCTEAVYVYDLSTHASWETWVGLAVLKWNTNKYRNYTAFKLSKIHWNILDSTVRQSKDAFNFCSSEVTLK